LNSKGVSLLLFVFIFAIPLAMSVIKLSVAFWNSQGGGQAAKSAERLGFVAADAAMDEYGVPKELQKAIKEEAKVFREVAADQARSEQTN
jgi:hypothetical protein